MRNWSSLFSILQRVGQSLMVPVSVLPAAGLLIAFGRLFPETHLMHSLFVQGGLSVFKELPLIFAIGVAIGFSGGAGVAGLAAAVGHFLVIALLKIASTHGAHAAQSLVIDTGVFGGILVGLVAAFCYNRYHEVQLPHVFGFFSGKRLVPIMTAFFSIFLAGVLAVIWPPLQEGIRAFGHFVVNSEFGPAFYAAGKRLLIPAGLHHVYYPSFLYEFGEFVKASGEIVRGDTARYYAGDPTAGRFMAGEFPIMLFGLPAAALAMVMTARPEKRKLVGGVMLSAGLTSILTGITEPIEFSFIFVAPVLYLVHVFLAFVSGFLTNLFEIQLGYTFSASLIDFATGFFNQKNSLSLWLVIGPAMALLYFFSFYFLIRVFDLKTPGREIESATPEGFSDPESSQHHSKKNHLNKDSERIKKIAAALGGPENWLQLDSCITRLRMKIKDPAQVDEASLKALGASGLLKAGQNIQVVFGVQSDAIREALRQISLTKQDRMLAPLSGKILPLEQVPDATFSQKLLGDGFAILPSEGLVLSPFAGTVTSILPSAHAVGLTRADGLEVLIHVGIDTVKMKGEGFTAFVREGDHVEAGQKLLQADLTLIQGKGFSLITPILFTSGEPLPAGFIDSKRICTAGVLLWEELKRSSH